MKNRIIENDIYLPVLKELIEEGRSVRLNIRGQSMLPFLFDIRDSVIIEPVTRALKKGDIVIFQRKSGAYIMHRICRVDNSHEKFYLVGDAQKTIEGPVDIEQIFGIITKVCRNGKWITNKSPVWWFYDKVWSTMRPFRTKLLLGIIALKSKFSK